MVSVKAPGKTKSFGSCGELGYLRCVLKAVKISPSHFTDWQNNDANARWFSCYRLLAVGWFTCGMQWPWSVSTKKIMYIVSKQLFRELPTIVREEKNWTVVWVHLCLEENRPSMGGGCFRWRDCRIQYLIPVWYDVASWFPVVAYENWLKNIHCHEFKMSIAKEQFQMALSLEASSVSGGFTEVAACRVDMVSNI